MNKFFSKYFVAILVLVLVFGGIFCIFKSYAQIRPFEISEASGNIRYIAPNGSGNGSSWANASSLSNVNQLIASSTGGDEIWIRADQGEYTLLSTPIMLSNGGSSLTTPIIIKGVDVGGGSTVKPTLRGNRANPWSPSGSAGT